MSSFMFSFSNWKRGDRCGLDKAAIGTIFCLLKPFTSTSHSLKVAVHSASHIMPGVCKLELEAVDGGLINKILSAAQ